MFKAWTATVDEICSTTLNFPLITRNEETNLIAVNFDPKVRSKVVSSPKSYTSHMILERAALYIFISISGKDRR